MHIDKNSERDILALGLFKDFTMKELEDCVSFGGKHFSDDQITNMKRALEFHKIYNQLGSSKEKMNNDNEEVKKPYRDNSDDTFDNSTYI